MHYISQFSIKCLLLMRWLCRWSRKETTTLPVGPGLEICLAITPGKSKAEGVVKAKGQVITWSIVAEVKPALAALQEERAALITEQEDRVFKRGEEEYDRPQSSWPRNRTTKSCSIQERKSRHMKSWTV